MDIESIIKKVMADPEVVRSNLSHEMVRKYFVDGKVPDENTRQACVAILNRIVMKARADSFMSSLATLDKGSYAVMLAGFVTKIKQGREEMVGQQFDYTVDVGIEEDDLKYAKSIAATSGLGVEELLGLLIKKVLMTTRRYDA